MPKFRKKPIEVEAVQFTGDNWAEMHAFTGHRLLSDQINMVDAFNPIGTYLTSAGRDNTYAELWVDANGTVLPIPVGEWVIKDSLGFYPCQEDKFTETYDSRWRR